MALISHCIEDCCPSVCGERTAVIKILSSLYFHFKIYYKIYSQCDTVLHHPELCITTVGRTHSTVLSITDKYFAIRSHLGVSSVSHTVDSDTISEMIPSWTLGVHVSVRRGQRGRFLELAPTGPVHVARLQRN